MKLFKKIILIIFILSAFLAGGFWVQADSSPADSFQNTLFGRASSIINEFLALAQESSPQEAYFFPNYPQRLLYIVSELSQAGKDLTALNEQLQNDVAKCDCSFTQSQCEGGGLFCQSGPLGAIGDPCRNREEIRNDQSKIKDENDQITYLMNLLRKEMDTGLQGELNTLRPEVAADLKSNLDKILEQSQNMLPPSQNNLNLPENCTAEPCSANCSLGAVFKIRACIIIGTGAQKAIEMKFKVGVKLDDLKLGRIGIKNVDLGLPDEIQLPKVGDLNITIPSQQIAINFPETTLAELKAKNLLDLSSQSFTVSSQLSLPSPPAMNLSCPAFPSFPSQTCDSSSDQENVELADYEWYFQTFAYLSEQCQQLPRMVGANWLNEGAQACFDPDKLPSTIVAECQSIWEQYCTSEGPKPEIPQICQIIRTSCDDKQSQEAAALQCQSVSGGNNPSACQLNPALTLKNKCDELKNGGTKEPPDPCKIAPLFTGKIEMPATYQKTASPRSCSAQTIGNYPSSVPACSFSPPTVPKITFPKIIIPDVILPSFSIFPFLEVKLPSFYFEDLALPDIDLCNLNDCTDIFPNLSFNFPSLNLPQINSSLRPPDLNINFQGAQLKVPLPEIKADIQFPPIVLGVPDISQFNLANLMTPELSMPQIQLPQPRFYFAFSGIDVSAIFELIVTFILNALDVPDYSACLDTSISSVPLRVILPDYYFYWPAFPQIPQIPFCQNIQSFCRDLKAGLRDVTNKVDQIEAVLNQTLSEKVQQKLNKVSQLTNQELTGKINEILQLYSQMLRAEIQKALGLATIDNGIIRIPPVSLTLPEKNITIHLSQELSLPDKITVPWPAELKRIAVSGGLGYDLPSIPLSKLSYEKEIPIKGPAFQPRTISIDLGALGNRGECIASPPSGGNPCPQGEFQSNINSIKNVQQQVSETSQKIVDILE
jgi:hypothetical protein